MEEESSWSSYSLTEKCSHKAWKVRLEGYTDAIKLFYESDGKDSSAFEEFDGLVLKAIGDSNTFSQEKGLEAALIFLQKYPRGAKQAKDIMPVIVSKCLGASKPKTKEFAVEITMKLIELDQCDVVLEELVKGTSLKNPKIVIACISTLTLGLSLFGPKVVDIKLLINIIPTLSEDRDKLIRDETRCLIVEIYRWIGSAIKPKLSFLKQCQLLELETEFSTITTQKQVPSRFVKSETGRPKSSNSNHTENTVRKKESNAVDTYQLLDSVNILAKIPSNFYECVESKKWQERKQTLDNLEKLLEYPKFEKGDYKELIRCLSRIISEDSNISVVTSAIKCLVKLSQGLKSYFHNYSAVLLPVLLEKFKEKKVSVVHILREATDAMFLTLSFESMQTDVFASLESKNPSVQAETVLFIGRCFAKVNSSALTKKALRAYVLALLKTLNESDPVVRDASAEALGTAMKAVGENGVIPLLAEVDSLKLNKIREYYEKAVVNPIDRMSSSMKKSSSKSQPLNSIEKSASDKNIFEKGLTTSQCSEKDLAIDEEIKEVPHNTEPTETDLSTKITDQILSDMSDKNWSVRNEALTTVLTLIQSVTSMKPHLGKLPTSLVARISDSNPKIALLALDICKMLALAMGAKSKVHFKIFCRAFLAALSDHRPNVRAAALTCISTWTEQVGCKELFDGELIPEALKTGSPSLRTELYTLLAQILPTSTDALNTNEDLMSCIPYVFANLEDRHVDVRKAAGLVIPGIMTHIGYHNMLRQSETFKPGSRAVVVSLLEKFRGEVPETTKKSSLKCKLGDSPRRDRSPKPDTRLLKTVSRSSSKTRDESPSSPMLPVSKQQRMLQEQRMKTLRWNFASPRSEFVDSLRDQMVNAKIGKALITNMFHSDFKYHLKAVEMLASEVDQIEALKSNFDLILKWSTLRFFDTNPAVLIKVLEYLQQAFANLLQNEYNMTDYEANSFIPYLILKFGDPKDTVRDRVRSIIRQIVVVYSPVKVYPMLVEGTKSKNVRQRSECLEELDYFLETFGASLCPLNSLKDIGKQISDRDSSVRNGAINCIIKVWYLEGDKIYRALGDIPSVDMNMLEEKLRRMAKSRPVSMTITKQRKTPDRPRSAPEVSAYLDNVCVAEYQKPASEIESEKIKELLDIDVSFLDTPITMPEYLSAKVKKREPICAVPKSESFALLTTELSSPNINLAYQAACKLRVLLDSPKDLVFDEYVNDVVESLVAQLRLVNSYSLEVYGLILPQTYRVMFRLIDDVFVKRVEMAQMVTVKNLQALIYELVYAAEENTTEKFVDGGYSRIILIYISRIIENSDFTAVTCACVKLIVSLTINPSSKVKTIETCTKCLLKTVHLLKKSLAGVESKINVDRILFECHIFFEAFPQYTWKDRPTNFPLKTVKALLLALVQWKGKDIFLHLTLIESSSSTELCLYLRKLLKSQNNSCKPSSTRLTKAMSEHLSDVFMKIASESTAKEGLLLLFEFKKENPHIDLTPYLAPTSKYFQDYVANGLKDIEREVTIANLANEDLNSPCLSASTSAADDGKEVFSISEDNLAQYYLDKLKLYHKQVGYPPPQCPDFVSKK